MVRGGEGQHRTRAGQGEKSEDRVRWGQVESKEGTRQGEGRITEMQSKDKARGHREGPTRERGAGGGSSSLGGHDGSRDPAGLDALGEKTGSWVGLQLVGSQLRPTLTRLLITASSSAEGLLPTSRSIHSGLVPTGWSVSRCLSALLSDQPGDPSTLLAGHPGLTTSPRVTLELPIHPPPQGHLNFSPTQPPLLSPPHVPFRCPHPFFSLPPPCQGNDLIAWFLRVHSCNEGITTVPPSPGCGESKSCYV